MGGMPYGLQWPAVYPLMDRCGLDDAEWDALHDDLMLMERVAVATMREHSKD